MKKLYTLILFFSIVFFRLPGQVGSSDVIISNNAFLKGQYIEVGVASCGCFGTTVTQPSGYHGNVGGRLGFVADPAMDGWSAGYPAYNGDYFLPGSPEEGWGVEINGSNYGNFSKCGTYNIPVSSVSIGTHNSTHYAIWTGSKNGLDITQETSFEDDGTYFMIKVDLTNSSGSDMYDLFYMRNVDPDNEVMSGGAYATMNSIIYQPNTDPCDRALVSATGTSFGMYLGLAAVDPRARVTHGGFSNRDASDIYYGSGFYQSGTVTADRAISIAFKIDALPAGETTTLYYAYILDQSQVNAAIGNLTRLVANGMDITNSLVFSGCEEPVVLEIMNAESYTWEWSPSTYLSSNVGTRVTCSAPPGIYSYSAVGSNECGNAILYNFTLEINADSERPSITCSSDMVVGECDNPITITPPEVTDNCGVSSLTHDSPYGASQYDASGTYPPGIHSIKWTAVDYAENSSFCIQTVTVVATPPKPVAPDVVYTYGDEVILNAVPDADHYIRWYTNPDLSDTPVELSEINLGVLDYGTYARYATQVSNETACESDTVVVSITINKKSLEVTGDNQTKVYGEADPALTYTITSGSLVGSDAISGSLTRDAGEDVGDYAITQGDLTAGSNYDLSYVSGTLSITQASLEVTGDNQTKVYGEADPAFTYTITSGSLVGSDAISGSLTRDTGEDVGDYSITQGDLTAGDNYNLSYVSGTLSITQAPLEVTGDNQTKVYGETDPALTYTIISGSLVGSDAISGSLTRDTGEDVGDYAITQGDLTAGSNYNLSYVSGTLSITQAPLEVTGDNQTKVYGEADPALTYTITSGSLVGSDAISGSLTRDAGEDVGDYAITQGDLTAGSNYNLNYVSGTLSITQAPLEVTGDNQTKVYGEADPALTYTITSGNLVGSDAISGSLTRDTGEDVGDYAITQGALTAGGNYDLSYIPGTLSITQASLEVTGDNQTKTYGEADPAFTYVITSGSLVGSDAISGSLTRDTGEDVGDYAITQGDLTAGSNYDLSYVSGTLSITQAPLEVTGDNQTKVYGEADPALSYTITLGSLVGSDAISGSLTRDAGEDVGDYSITQGDLTAGDNYNLSYVPGTLSITQAPLEVTGDNQTKVYGEADPGFTYTITSGSLVGSDAISGFLTRDTGEDVGDYSITQGDLTAGGNYNLSYVPGTLSITQALLEVTGDDKTKVYGEADPALSYTITSGSLVGSDAISGSLTRDTGEDVGDYSITQGDLTAGDNYNLSYVPGTLSITQAPLEVTGDNQTKVYGEADPGFTYTITSGSLVGSDAISGSLSRDTGEDVGDYSITQGDLTAGSNYDLSYIPGTLSITQASLEVTGDDQTKTYGEADPVFTYIITSGSLVGSDAISGSLSRDPGEDVGDYTITQGDLTAGSNYDLSYVSGTLSITQASLEVTGDDQTKVYGEADPALSYTITSGSLVGSDAISGSLSRDTGEDVGDYSITQGDLTAGSNYNLSYASGTLSITQAPLEVTGDDQTKVYGEADPALSYTITSGSLVGSDAISGFLTRDAGEDVGDYSITQGDLTAGSNYNLSYVSGTLSITQAPLEVTGDNQTKVYGEADPALSYTITSGSLVGSDAISGDLIRVAGEDAGDYPIDKGTLSVSSNYDLSYVSGTLSITQAPLEVTGDNQTKVYGEADPAFTYTITSGSLVGSDAISGSLSRDAGEDVGDYAITQGDLTAGNNYNLSYVPGTLSITQAPLEVTGDDQTKIYGEADPVFTYIITSGSLVGSDAISGSLTRDSGEDVGDYTITQGDLTAGDNYDLSYIDGELSINKKGLLMIADDKTRIYGESNPELTFTCSGFVFGEDRSVLDADPDLSTTADELSDAGKYPIAISGGSDNNYEFEYEDGEITVEKAELDVTADDKEKVYLEDNPVFSFIYSGFVNNDDAEDIDEAPALRCDTDNSSPVGYYDIIPYGGSDNNYSFKYNNGTLNIVKADQVITFDLIPEGLRITEDYNLIAVSTSGLDVVFGVSDPLILYLDESSWSIEVLHEGNVTVTAYQEGNENWNAAIPVPQDILTLPTFDNSNSLITPNGDGMNDYWYIPYIEEYGQVKVRVFNRFGKLVYKTDAYMNDWDGTSNGKPLPEGSYYYILDTSERGIIKGVINIVR